MNLKNYLTYLQEEDDKNVKIHPRRKELSSIAAVANPFDDIAFGALGAGTVMKKFDKAKNAASGLKRVGMVGAGAAIGIAGGAAMIAGYRVIRSMFDNCTKQCGTFQVNTPKRQLCMLQCKKVSLEKHITLLKNHSAMKQMPPVESQLSITNRKIELMKQYLEKGKNNVK